MVRKIPTILIDWQNINHPAPNPDNLPDISMNFSTFARRERHLHGFYSKNPAINIYNHIEEMLNGKNYYAPSFLPKGPQKSLRTGSVREYFQKISHGQLDIQFIILNASNGISDVSGAYGVIQKPTELGIITSAEYTPGGSDFVDAAGEAKWNTFLSTIVNQTILNEGDWSSRFLLENGYIPPITFLTSELIQKGNNFWVDTFPTIGHLQRWNVPNEAPGFLKSPAPVWTHPQRPAYVYCPMRLSSSAIIDVPPPIWHFKWGEKYGAPWPGYANPHTGTVVPAYPSFSLDQPIGIGVLVHETLHSLLIECSERFSKPPTSSSKAWDIDFSFVPDLYSSGTALADGLGLFCVMSRGPRSGKSTANLIIANYPESSYILPNFPCAWVREALCWAPHREHLNSIEIIDASGIIILSSNCTNILIPPIETHNKTFRVNHPNGDDYWLIENRQSIGFDRQLLGNKHAAGLAIWHINKSTIWDDASPNSRAWKDKDNKISGYGIALEQADGLWDLENNINNGNESDLWSPTVIGSQTEFGPYTTPNTNGMDGTPSGIRIYNIDYVGTGPSMKFSVELLCSETPCWCPITASFLLSDIPCLTILLNGKTEINHTLGEPYIDAGATAINSSGINIPVNVIETIDIHTLGTYYIHYSASNEGTMAFGTRIVNIIHKIQSTPKTFFPENSSVVNPYHKYQMSKAALKTFSSKNTTKKKKYSTFGLGNGGIAPPSARVGSMDRLSRLKAKAIRGKL